MTIILGTIVLPFVLAFAIGVMYVSISVAWWLFNKIFGIFGGK